ncbi:MAG TPA: CC/Se motif family (seleno)protein, partial [Symbiobacteriaceae bacterium]|nr:CC/Se motif family (seleno)protein [Symbiobacteriaceae bacterium]
GGGVVMRVVLEPEAADLIREKGGQLILYVAPVSGCCGVGAVPVPSWEIGRPRLPLETYSRMVIDEVEVFVDKELDLPGRTMRVHATKVLAWRSLSLDIVAD